MEEYKIMPHNIEAEQAVLGCILIDQHSQADILAEIATTAAVPGSTTSPWWTWDEPDCPEEAL